MSTDSFPQPVGATGAQLKRGDDEADADEARVRQYLFGFSVAFDSMHGHGHGHALLAQGWHGSRPLTLSAVC